MKIEEEEEEEEKAISREVIPEERGIIGKSPAASWELVFLSNWLLKFRWYLFKSDISLMIGSEAM